MNSWWTQALPTGAGGSTGGACIAAGQGLVAHRLDPDEVNEHGLPIDPQDWVATVVELQSFMFSFAEPYLDDSVGLSNRNRCNISFLAARLQLAGVPWLIAADWNMEPAQFLETNWPATLKARIVVPEGAVQSCTSGSGRLLDYLLVSGSCGPFIHRTWSAQDTPWKPHAGIGVEFKQAPWDVKIRVLWNLATPVPVKRNKKDGFEKEAPWTWSNLSHLEKKPAPVRCELVSSLAFSFFASDAVQNGQAYGKWLDKVELQNALRNPLPDTEPHRSIGRSKGPRFIEVSACQKLALHKPVVDLTTSASLRF